MSPAVAMDDDERRMWQVAADAESEFERRSDVHADPSLDAYLLEVARRLQPPEVFQAIPFRIRVIRDARPGAFSAANGAIYLFTGFLARMESEAELAALLAHELAHAIRRHSLRQQRRSQSFATGQVGLARLASMMDYSRDLEVEADLDGVARMRAAGYDVADAARMFERLRDWKAGEKLPEKEAKFASHPRIEERIESMRRLAASGTNGGVRNPDVYLRRTASVLVWNGRVELAAGRFAAAREQVERYLALEPKDATGHLLLGEIARREGTAGAADAALSSYRRAVELDPRAAQAWRGLGLVFARKGDRAEARRAYARYLELAPDAPDRAHVRTVLENLPGGKP
jgi:predicted Zn-dependent protease